MDETNVEQPQTEEAVGSEVEIKNMPAMTVMAIEHRGPYTELESVMDQLISWVMREGHPYSGPPFAILYDDPQYVAESDLRSEVCVPMEEDLQGKDNVVRKQMPALTMAASIHKGPYHEVHKAYEVIFDYLNEHGYEYKAVYGCHEAYLNSPVDIESEEQMVEVRVPIGKPAEQKEEEA